MATHPARMVTRVSDLSQLSEAEMQETRAFIIAGRHYNGRDADFRIGVLDAIRGSVRRFDIFEEIPKERRNAELLATLKIRSKRKVSELAGSFAMAPREFLGPMLLEYKRLAERHGSRVYPIGNSIRTADREIREEFAAIVTEIRRASSEGSALEDFESKIPSRVEFLLAVGRLADLDNPIFTRNINEVSVTLNIPFVVSVGSNHAEYIAANLEGGGNVVIVMHEVMRALSDLLQQSVAIARRGGPENADEILVLAKNEASEIIFMNDNIGMDYMRSLMNARTLLGVEALANEMRAISRSDDNPDIDVERFYRAVKY
ncbi:MAG: hypothetical protein KGH72_03425 [Candidatus Micrarchaeota archaeon]|nr:hypothetical protein [Candidatus Micrarchaeota archaeon]